jgi:hypothetical protein
MKKVVGYVVSIAGIVVMALGFGMINFESEFLSGVGKDIIIGVGIAAIVVGVVISLNAGGGRGRRKIKGGETEVPIYEGVGKNRRIVGYRTD